MILLIEILHLQFKQYDCFIYTLTVIYLKQKVSVSLLGMIYALFYVLYIGLCSLRTCVTVYPAYKNMVFLRDKTFIVLHRPKTYRLIQ